MHPRESLTPLIQIQQQLESCDEALLLSFGNVFKKKLMQETLWDRIDVIKKLLCCLHNNLTDHFLQELLEVFVDKEANECNETDGRNIDIISDNKLYPKCNNIEDIPKDLLIHSFQFLNIFELYQLEKTCRSLCIIARDPSSLHHLSIEYKPYFEAFIHYQHLRYSKLRSLTLHRYNDEDMDENNDDRFGYWTSLLPVFNHLSSIIVNNMNVTDNRLSAFGLPSSICIGDNVRYLKLCYVSTECVLTAICNCRNIETFDLETVFEFNGFDEEIKDEDYHNAFIKQNMNSMHFPLKYLKHLTIDLWSIRFVSVQYLLYWILSNGEQKTFTLMDNAYIGDLLIECHDEHKLSEFFNPNCGCLIYNLQQKALLNITKLNLGVLELHCINNISKWINLNKNIKFQRVIVDLINIYAEHSFADLVHPLDVILSQTEESKIFLSNDYKMIPSKDSNLPCVSMNCNDDGVVGAMRHWPSQILEGKLQNHRFSEINIMTKIYIRCNLQLPCIYNYGTESTLFQNVIKYWLELKVSGIAQLHYDVTFVFEKGFCKYSMTMEDLMQNCNKYPIKVDFIHINNGFRVSF